MNNTVIYENPIRKKLKQVMSVLVLIVIMLAVVLVLISLINKQTYNGKTVTTEGVVSKIDDGDTVYIHLADSETKFNTNPISDDIADFSVLVGKNVVIYTPEQQFGSGDPLILGLTVDGKEVVNAEKNVEHMREQNKIVIIVMAVLCGAFAVGTCALAVWRINVAHEKVYPLGEKYVEYYAEKQPNCPETKYLKTFLIVWIIVMLAPIIVMAIWNGIEEQSDTVNFIILGVTLAFAVGGIIASVFLKKWLVKKNMDFYAERYPFDFTDISHIPMKKDVRESIEKEMREDLEKHPHYQGDGGNGYLAKFTDHGVELYIPDFWKEEQELDAPTEQKIDVPAEDVFGLQQKETADTEAEQTATITEQNITVDEQNTDANSDENEKPILTLSYEEANFEAVPYFKPRPLFVVIKSRLTPNERYPEELVNDLHFLLDVNLLKTLQTFSVPVENLDNILQNKKQLMLDELAKRKQKRGPTQQ